MYFEWNLCKIFERTLTSEFIYFSNQFDRDLDIVYCPIAVHIYIVVFVYLFFWYWAKIIILTINPLPFFWNKYQCLCFSSF